MLGHTIIAVLVAIIICLLAILPSRGRNIPATTSTQFQYPRIKRGGRRITFNPITTTNRGETAALKE